MAKQDRHWYNARHRNTLFLWYTHGSNRIGSVCGAESDTRNAARVSAAKKLLKKSKAHFLPPAKAMPVGAMLTPPPETAWRMGATAIRTGATCTPWGCTFSPRGPT